MNDVATDQKRDAQAAFLDGYALQLIHQINVDNIEHRTNATCPQILAEIIWRITLTCIKLTHLADFLGQCHLRK